MILRLTLVRMVTPIEINTNTRVKPPSGHFVDEMLLSTRVPLEEIFIAENKNGVNGAKLRKYLRIDFFEQEHIKLKKMHDNLEASKKIAQFINKIEDIDIAVQLNKLLKETKNAENGRE